MLPNQALYQVSYTSIYLISRIIVLFFGENVKRKIGVSKIKSKLKLTKKRTTGCGIIANRLYVFQGGHLLSFSIFSRSCPAAGIQSAGQIPAADVSVIVIVRQGLQ